MEGTRRVVYRIAMYILMVLVALYFAFPLVWMALTALKHRVDIFATPPKFVFTPQLNNILTVVQSDFLVQWRNSLIVAALSTTIALTLGSLTAYGFSRYGRWKGSDNVLFWILSQRMLPPIAVVVPFYLFFRTVRLLDTQIALIAVYTIFNLSFSVWLLKVFFDEIPIEVEEAAKMDGYTPLQVFLKVSLPLSAAGLATTAVFCLIQSLNEFLLALVLTSSRAVTAPVALANFQKYFGLDWGQFSAAAALFLLPVVLFTIFVRNYLIRGMSFGRLR